MPYIFVSKGFLLSNKEGKRLDIVSKGVRYNYVGGYWMLVVFVEIS